MCGPTMPDAPPKAVLFDWDGTLVNSWPIIHESMNRTLEEMGHDPWTMEETLERVRKSLREAFPPLFGDRWEEARDIFYTAYRAVHLERVEKKDGAEELIELLDGLGSHLGVVSNKSGRHLRAESIKLGWDRFFGGYLVGATDAKRGQAGDGSGLHGARRDRYRARQRRLVYRRYLGRHGLRPRGELPYHSDRRKPAGRCGICRSPAG